VAIDLFGSSSNKRESTELKIIEHLALNNARLTEIILLDRLRNPPVDRKPILTLSITIQNQLFIMADITLNLGIAKNGIFTLTDAKTGSVITDASFSNQAVGSSSNPEFATFALDPSNPNRVIGTPVAAGSGTVVITTDASWTDLGDGAAKSASFSVTKAFTVIGSADGANFDVVFSHSVVKTKLKSPVCTYWGFFCPAIMVRPVPSRHPGFPDP